MPVDILVSAVGIGAQSNSLAALSISVGNIDVVKLEVGSLDTKSSSAIVVEAVSLALLRCDGDLVAAVSASVGSVSVDRQLSAATRNKDLLVIGTLVNEDALLSRCCSRERVDCSLNGTELTASGRLLDSYTSRGRSCSTSSERRRDETQCCEELHGDVDQDNRNKPTMRDGTNNKTSRVSVFM